MRIIRSTIFFTVLLALSSCGFQGEQVDLIVHNARIYSMDDSFRVFEAMAIRDGRIVETGPQQQILNKYSADRVIDAQKKPVYPGFIDGHCHFLGYGYTLQEVNLVGTRSFDEVLERVRDFASKNDNKWIIGRGWDQNDWKSSYLGSLTPEQIAVTDTANPTIPFPDCFMLDSLYPDRAVVLKRIDGHAMIVNSYVLNLAGIHPDTKVEGGSIGVTGLSCTGLLIDNAMQLVENIIPGYTDEQKTKALLDAQARCFEFGLTTVDDAGLLHEDIDLIKALHTSGELKMRIYAMLSDSLPNYDYYLERGIDTTSDRLTVRAFKFYADGALGSRGACLLNPYQDILEELGRRDFGMMLETEEHFREKFAMLYDAGFQVCTHAIGDSANRVIMNLYGEVLGIVNDNRWRVEHAQVVDPADLPLFGQYSIIPSVQPTHATSDMPWAWKRLGRNRIRYAYSYKDLKNQLGIITLGTDFPVEDISPFGTFYASIARMNSRGEPEGGFQTENALTREETLRGMTSWAALANFEEHKKGSLEKGKYADFVILDRDLMTVSEEYIPDTKVMYTVIGGEVVYTRD